MEGYTHAREQRLNKERAQMETMRIQEMRDKARLASREIEMFRERVRIGFNFTCGTQV